MGGHGWALPGDPGDEAATGRVPAPVDGAGIGTGQFYGASQPGGGEPVGERRPPEGGRGGSRAWLIPVGFVVLLVGLVIAGVVVSGGDSDTTSSDRAATDAPAKGRATSTTASPGSPSSPTSQSTATTAPPWQDVASADGAFHLRLPGSWGSITVTGDMTGRGTEMFPDDPEHAGLADQVFDSLITPQTRFVAMDGDAPATVEQTAMIFVESGPSGLDQQATYEALKQYTDVAVQREGRAPTAVGEAAWFEFSPPGLPGMVGRKYVLVHDGTAWLLTFWSSDMATQGPVADQLVASFTPR